jgi:hypothetical protein
MATTIEKMRTFQACDPTDGSSPDCARIVRRGRSTAVTQQRMVSDQRITTARSISPPNSSTEWLYRKLAIAMKMAPSVRPLATRSPSTSPRQARSSATRIRLAVASVSQRSDAPLSHPETSTARSVKRSICTMTITAAATSSSASSSASVPIQLRRRPSDAPRPIARMSCAVIPTIASVTGTRGGAPVASSRASQTAAPIAMSAMAPVRLAKRSRLVPPARRVATAQAAMATTVCARKSAPVTAFGSPGRVAAGVST